MESVNSTERYSSYNQSRNKTTHRGMAFPRTSDNINIERLPSSTTEPTIDLKTIGRLTYDMELLQKENTLINNRISEMQKKENRMLNRFGWTLLIGNFGLVLLIIFITVIFINNLYPFIKEVFKEDSGSLMVFNAIAGAIFLAILGFWWKLEKLLNYVRERDSKDI